MSKQTSYDKLSLLGVDIDALTIDEAIDYICQRAVTNQPACYITKPYVEFLDQAGRNPATRELINGAELTLADGVALLWAANFLYAGPRNLWRFGATLGQIVLRPNRLRWPLPDRLAGTNFTWPLLETAANRGIKVFIIGEPKGNSITETARVIQRRLPNLQLVGSHGGRDPQCPPGEVSDAWLQALAGTIQSSSAQIVLVAMGFPLQEKVCAHLASHLNQGVFIGEGGTFDYESFGGVRPKAPGLIQRIGLEWLWRLILEPHRLSRQLAIPRFIWSIWRSR